VVVSDSADPSFLERAEESGADSFWYAADRQSLLSVLDRTMEGKSVFPAHAPVVKIGQAESSSLSEKEIQILREVVKGDSNKEIAETLQMSYYTVRDYVKGLLEKTNLQSRTELAVKAVSSGLIILENNTSKPVR
jgi:DNA-binding NarL/FixJ family response regulator